MTPTRPILVMPDMIRHPASSAACQGSGTLAPIQGDEASFVPNEF
jgi:hypothetical protein